MGIGWRRGRWVGVREGGRGMKKEKIGKWKSWKRMWELGGEGGWWVGVREGGGRVINNLDHYGQFIIGAFCL